MEKKKSTRKKITLLQAIEKVIESVEDSKLDEKILSKVKPYSCFLAESYGITEMQAVLFCVCLEKGPPTNANSSPAPVAQQYTRYASLMAIAATMVTLGIT